MVSVGQSIEEGEKQKQDLRPGKVRSQPPQRQGEGREQEEKDPGPVPGSQAEEKQEQQHRALPNSGMVFHKTS